ncbi:MAG: hypothetical protein PHQ23_17010, partial [Candidatus Wallbacteria bacterium]|nr:hypothetical protein [Candidatus Wallbacteria bacterium]
VPVCLVNEEGKKLACVPVYMPFPSIQKGPVKRHDNAEMTLVMQTPYSNDTTDRIELTYWNTENRLRDQTLLTETSTASIEFRSDDQYYRVKINDPIPPIISKEPVSFRKEMDITFTAGAQSCNVKLPIWRGPGTEFGGYYIASNQILNEGDSDDFDQSTYFSKNSIFRIKITKRGQTENVVTADLTSYDRSSGKEKVIQEIKGIECKSSSKNVYYSDPFCLVPEWYENLEIEIGGKKYPVLKGTPCILDKARPDIEVGAAILHEYVVKLVSKTFGPAYSIRASNLDEMASEFPFGYNAFFMACENLSKHGYFVAVDESPTKSEFVEALSKYRFSVLYTSSHGVAQDDVFSLALYAQYLDIPVFPLLTGFNEDLVFINQAIPGTSDYFELPDKHGYELVFLNACFSASGEVITTGCRDRFNALRYMGCKGQFNHAKGEIFANKFFDLIRTDFKAEESLNPFQHCVLKALDNIWPDEYSAENTSAWPIELSFESDSFKTKKISGTP